MLLGFIGCSVHWDSAKDLEQEVDSPTEGKETVENFVCCGNTTVYCAVLSLYCGGSAG